MRKEKNYSFWIRLYSIGFGLSLCIPMTLVIYGLTYDSWEWLKDLAIPSGILSFTLLQLLHGLWEQRFEAEKHDENKRADFVRKVTLILFDHHDLEHKPEKYSILMRSTGMLEKEARILFPSRPTIASQLLTLDKIYHNMYREMLKAENTNFYEDIEDMSTTVTDQAISIYHDVLQRLYTRGKL